MKKLIIFLFFVFFLNQTYAQSLTVSESHLNATCFGYCNGTINVTATGGTPPYSGTGFFSSLCAGTYNITVTDAVGSSASISVTITEPPLLSANVASTNVTCNGACDGTASVIVTGGTRPYTYLWCNGSTVNSAYGFCPGSCTVTVTDNNGCEAIDTVVITEPPPINFSFIGTNASCYGSCDANICCNSLVGGSPPYTYLWTPSGITSACLSSACAGSYSLCVIDVNGCMTCNTVIVNGPPPIQVFASITNASCPTCCDGDILLNPSGGSAPFVINYTSGPTPSPNAYCSGTYNYCVTDANGCSYCDSATVSFPLSISNSEFDGTFRIFPIPARNFINVEIEKNTDLKNCNLSIFDNIGKLVLKEKIIQNKQRIDISELLIGFYFVQIWNGDKIVNKKIIKEHH